MIKRLLLTAIAALTFVHVGQPALQAQQYEQQLLSLATNNIAGSSTEAGDSSAITVTRYSEVGIHVNFALDDTGTSAITLLIKGSLDGTNYATVGQHSIAIAGNGTTAVNYCTNLNVGSFGYIKVDSIQNANTADCTNLTVRYSLKPVRRKGY